jgi:hypothetical protein
MRSGNQTIEFIGAKSRVEAAPPVRHLVDLVRFELTISSMPFKKYQSLADSLAQNKRLSKRRRGLRWTPVRTRMIFELQVESVSNCGLTQR